MQGVSRAQGPAVRAVCIGNLAVSPKMDLQICCAAALQPVFMILPFVLFAKEFVSGYCWFHSYCSFTWVSLCAKRMYPNNNN
jgi:hypothetical protein